ncbi:MAG: hypothetical protein WAU07_01070, partial [Microgenomates group bacterium]
GAYYSLLALLKSKPTTTLDPNTFFLYGEKDPYLTDLPKDLRKQTQIIKGAVHNCIAGREKEVVGIITDLSDVKNLK